MENLDDANVFDKAEEAANSAMSQQLSAVKVLEDLGKGQKKISQNLEKLLEISKHILSYVIILGPYLTDVNLGKRKIGVNFLSIFLSNLPLDFLNEDECRLFSKFYQDRINDHHSLIPSIIKGRSKIFTL